MFFQMLLGAGGFVAATTVMLYGYTICLGEADINDPDQANEIVCDRLPAM